ncbi:hypothetical protein [Streptomyces bicolor]|uniref:hypothetical protein n=1 Tax=Streptomyces bicolor TaxID=66874 RepID=UPI0004E1C964|nr:hypothetical protein [Streptomyces bicolor]
MTAPDAVRPGDLVTVTHRPHPLAGRRLPVRAVRGRGAESLLCERPGGGLVTVLRSWTDRASDARPVQDREPRRAAGHEIRLAARPEITGGGAFQVSDTALHRLRASLALSVERLVGLDAAKYSATAGIPRPPHRLFSAAEKERPVSHPVRKRGRNVATSD